MGTTKYKYNATTGKVSFKFNFNAEQTTLFKEAYGYPALVVNPDNAEEMITNDMPLEVFFLLYHAEEMNNRMKQQYKSKKQTEIEAECNAAVDNSPEEDV